MNLHWALSLSLLSAVCWGQQAQAPAAMPAAPAPPPMDRFATVTAVTREPLDSKSCVSGKEFRSTITSPFIFSGEPVDSGAELIGHIQACNRDENDKLALAVVVIDSMSLPKGRILPVTAALQAVGPPLPPPRVTATGTDIGYVASTEFHQDMRAYEASTHNAELAEVARRGPSTVGILDNTSTGVVGLKHISIENAVVGSTLGWMLAADNAPLALSVGSQLVVRMRIAPPPPKQP
jgi:hypothetical protein